MTSVTINYLFNLAARCNAIEKILRRKGLLDDKEFMFAVREEVEALQPMKNIVHEEEAANLPWITVGDAKDMATKLFTGKGNIL